MLDTAIFLPLGKKSRRSGFFPLSIISVEGFIDIPCREKSLAGLHRTLIFRCKFAEKMRSTVEVVVDEEENFVVCKTVLD